MQFRIADTCTDSRSGMIGAGYFFDVFGDSSLVSMNPFPDPGTGKRRGSFRRSDPNPAPSQPVSYLDGLGT